MMTHQHTKETKKKMRQAQLTRYLQRPELKANLSKRNKKLGIKPPSALGRICSPEHRRKISIKNKGRKKTIQELIKLKKTQDVAFERILQEIPELEKQGFKCIPIGKPIPDIIGIKDGKIYAIEVEYNNVHPNYTKYGEESKKWFDEVLWILRKSL